MSFLIALFLCPTIAPQEEVSSRLLEQKQPIASASWSPDGRFIAVGAGSGTVTMLDAATGKVASSFMGHRRSVRHLVFSPDGSRLATCDEVSEVRLREIYSLKEPLLLKGQTTQPGSLAYSPDGMLLAVGDLNNPVHLWDGREGKLVRKVGGRMGGSPLVSFSPDGRTLATATSKLVTLWDVSTGAKRIAIQDDREDGKPPDNEKDEFDLFSSRGEVELLAFTPCGQFLVTAGGECARIRDAATGRQVTKLETGKHRGRDFSPDGRLLATLADETLTLWEIATGKPALKLKDNQLRDELLKFSPDGRRVLTEHWKGIVLWDLDVTGKKDLTTDEKSTLWSALEGQDAEKAYKAVRSLATGGQAAVEFLKERLLGPQAGEIGQWIAALDSEEVAVREKAVEELKGRGGAEPNIRKARDASTSAEAKARLDEILMTFASPVTNSPGRLRLLRSIQALELMGTTPARQALQALNMGDAKLALNRLKHREELTETLHALEESAKDPYRELAADPVLKARVGEVRAGLTPGLLKAMPGVEVRLARGGARSWTGVFLEAVSGEEVAFVNVGRRRYPDLTKSDLETVAVRALDGVQSPEEMGAVCEWLEWRRIAAAVPRLKEVLKSERDLYRLYAGKTLVALGKEEGAAPILALLKSKEFDEQYGAVVAAGQLRLKAAVPSLIDLAGKERGHTRGVAIWSMGRIGSKEAVPFLRGLGKNLEAAEALAELGARTEALVSALGLLSDQRDRSMEAGRMVRLLGRLGGPEAASMVIEWAAKNERDHFMIFPDLRWFDAKDLAPGIAKFLSHKDPQLKRNAIDLLGDLDSTDSAKEVAGVLKNGHPMDKAHALKALARLGAKEYVGEMRAALSHEHPWMRSHGAAALGILSERDATGAIAELLKDKDPWVRESAALALARLGRADSTAAIVEVLKTRSRERSPSIDSAVALCLLGSKEGLDSLFKHAEEWTQTLSFANAVRRPELWKKLQESALREDLVGPQEEIWASLAKAGGLPFDDSEMPRWFYRPGIMSWGGHFIRSRGGRTSIADALSEMARWTGESFVLEPNRLVILPHFQALEFWKRWYAEELNRK